MEHTESEAYELIDLCNENINSREVNSFSSYDEGVRDALLSLLERTAQPYIGRED